MNLDRNADGGQQRAEGIPSGIHAANSPLGKCFLYGLVAGDFNCPGIRKQKNTCAGYRNSKRPGGWLNALNQKRNQENTMTRLAVLTLTLLMVGGDLLARGGSHSGHSSYVAHARASKPPKIHIAKPGKKQHLTKKQRLMVLELFQ